MLADGRYFVSITVLLSFILKTMNIVHKTVESGLFVSVCTANNWNEANMTYHALAN